MTVISVHFQGKQFNITVIQVYAPTSNAKEANTEWFYEDLQDLRELKPPKNALFITGDWNAVVGSQEIPGEQANLALRHKSREKVNSILPREPTGHSKHLLGQHKRRLYTRTSPDGQCPIRLIIFSVAKDGEALYSQQKQDKQLTVSQIMNSLLPNSDLNR